MRLDKVNDKEDPRRRKACLGCGDRDLNGQDKEGKEYSGPSCKRSPRQLTAGSIQDNLKVSHRRVGTVLESEKEFKSRQWGLEKKGVKFEG